MVRQLAEIGHQVRLVYGVLRRVSGYRLLHGYPGKNPPVENFGTGSSSTDLNRPVDYHDPEILAKMGIDKGFSSSQ